MVDADGGSYRDSGDHRAGPTSSAAALAELIAGNRRFVTGTRIHPHQNAEHRAALAEAQAPFAAIFGCSDSRLAAEIIFDRGLGDLFVVRTAGHIGGAQVLGSIEYAVSELRVPLVVVLGHNSCGAIQAAYDAVVGGRSMAGNLHVVVEAIASSVRLAANAHLHDVDDIVDIHIRRTVDQMLRHCGPLAEAVEARRCAVVGMAYGLRAGQVRVVTPELAPEPDPAPDLELQAKRAVTGTPAIGPPAQR